MTVSQQEQHQALELGTPKWDAANINVISYTCAFQFMTCQNVCCEKCVLYFKCLLVFPCKKHVLYCSKTTVLLVWFLKLIRKCCSRRTAPTHWKHTKTVFEICRNVYRQNDLRSVLCLVWYSSVLVIHPVRQKFRPESICPEVKSHTYLCDVLLCTRRSSIKRRSLFLFNLWFYVISI